MKTWITCLALMSANLATAWEDFADFKKTVLSRLSPTDKTFVEAGLSKKVRGLVQKTWKTGDAGVIGDKLTVIEVIDEKTAVVRIGGGVYGTRGLPTDGWKVGREISTRAYVVIASPEEFETATGKKKYRAIVALSEEGRATWQILLALSKYPVFERHEFEIDGAKVKGVFVGMMNGQARILTIDDATPINKPLDELTEADQQWVRQEIREFSKKK